MLVLQRKQEHEDFPSVLPEFLPRGGARCLLLPLHCERVRVAGAPLLRCWKTATWAQAEVCNVGDHRGRVFTRGLGPDVRMQVGLFGVLACGQVSVRIRVGLTGRRLLCKSVCAHEP